MKKICFLILMLVGVSAKSNALQFSELCADLLNNNIANMTVTYNNGTSATIGMSEACQEFINNPHGESIASLGNTLAVVGIGIAVAVPFTQALYKYIYRRVSARCGYKRDIEIVKEQQEGVRILLNGDVIAGDNPAPGSIVERMLYTAQTADNMHALLSRTAQNVGNIQDILGNPVNDNGESVLQGGNLVTHLAGMSQQIQEIEHPHHE